MFFYKLFRYSFFGICISFLYFLQFSTKSVKVDNLNTSERWILFV
ncbi:hypothetical protein HMPREF0239_00126 [Clostridium sp. ATCC BAA-442]|nr:hypothetical protein HMPREF0239_00126 [Clostridium sp. ATCC BAA-442]